MTRWSHQTSGKLKYNLNIDSHPRLNLKSYLGKSAFKLATHIYFWLTFIDVYSILTHDMDYSTIYITYILGWVLWRRIIFILLYEFSSPKDRSRYIKLSTVLSIKLFTIMQPFTKFIHTYAQFAHTHWWTYIIQQRKIKSVCLKCQLPLITQHVFVWRDHYSFINFHFLTHTATPWVNVLCIHLAEPTDSQYREVLSNTITT